MTHHRGIVPYTTKTGVQIGLLYQKPPLQQSPEDEFIQSVLLGDRMSPSVTEIAEWIIYSALFALAVMLVLTWGAE